MTRLPDLERQLLEAARARERPRRRWWRIGLLGSSATLVLAASAVGAAQLFVPEGEPVPRSTTPQRTGIPKLGRGDKTLLSLRVPDPDGGLPWGVALARSADGRMFCAQTGRVQGDQLGVIGRDGTFNDDGAFHPLTIDANQSGVCGGMPPDGDLRLGGDGPPIPASGFTGGFDSAAGGCREHVPKATMSPQTRRRLRTVPICKQSSLRVVRYGFAGRDAVKVEFAGRTVRPDPDESGAYLFVFKPPRGDAELVITLEDGTECEELGSRTTPEEIRDLRGRGCFG